MNRVPGPKMYYLVPNTDEAQGNCASCDLCGKILYCIEVQVVSFTDVYTFNEQVNHLSVQPTPRSTQPAVPLG